MLLSNEEILAIRNSYARGTDQKTLAMKYRCRQTNISKIVRGDTHADVGGPRTKTGRASGDRHGLMKITDARVKELREAHAIFGYPYAELAKLFGISATQVRLIIIGKARRR